MLMRAGRPAGQLIMSSRNLLMSAMMKNSALPAAGDLI